MIQKFSFYLFLFSTLVFGIFKPSYAEELNSGRRQFYNVVELIKLIEIAREAGYSEEEIESLTIKDENKALNAMKYIQQELKEKKTKNLEFKKLLSKKYLTIQDILNDLLALEPKALSSFRDNLLTKVD